MGFTGLQQGARRAALPPGPLREEAFLAVPARGGCWCVSNLALPLSNKG